MSTTTAPGQQRQVSTRPPIVVPASKTHTATLIFFHGLGDQGDGWSQIFKSEMSLPYFKVILPNAASIPVTLNFGMRMPAWYDIYGLNPDSNEDEVGIEAAKVYAHSLIDAEVAAGTPANRIILGGFSMGAALAIHSGLTYKDPLGAVVSISGFLLQRQKIPGSHTANLKIPIFLGHGLQDPLVPHAFSVMSKEFLSKFNPNVELHAYQVDHGSTPQEHRDIKAFILQKVPETSSG